MACKPKKMADGGIIGGLSGYMENADRAKMLRDKAQGIAESKPYNRVFGQSQKQRDETDALDHEANIAEQEAEVLEQRNRESGLNLRVGGMPHSIDSGIVATPKKGTPLRMANGGTINGVHPGSDLRNPQSIGMVRGPGSSTSDEVPVTMPDGSKGYVANEEAVLPGDTVQAIGGAQAVNRLIKNTHTPVHSRIGGHANGWTGGMGATYDGMKRTPSMRSVITPTPAAVPPGSDVPQDQDDAAKLAQHDMARGIPQSANVANAAAPESPVMGGIRAMQDAVKGAIIPKAMTTPVPIASPKQVATVPTPATQAIAAPKDSAPSLSQATPTATQPTPTATQPVTVAQQAIGGNYPVGSTGGSFQSLAGADYGQTVMPSDIDQKTKPAVYGDSVAKQTGVVRNIDPNSAEGKELIGGIGRSSSFNSEQGNMTNRPQDMRTNQTIGGKQMPNGTGFAVMGDKMVGVNSNVAQYTAADGTPTNDWYKTADYQQGIARAQKDKDQVSGYFQKHLAAGDLEGATRMATTPQEFAQLGALEKQKVDERYAVAVRQQLENRINDPATPDKVREAMVKQLDDVNSKDKSWQDRMAASQESGIKAQDAAQKAQTHTLNMRVGGIGADTSLVKQQEEQMALKAKQQITDLQNRYINETDPAKRKALGENILTLLGKAKENKWDMKTVSLGGKKDAATGDEQKYGEVAIAISPEGVPQVVYDPRESAKSIKPPPEGATVYDDKGTKYIVKNGIPVKA